MVHVPVYPDIPVPHDLPTAIEAIKALKQAVESLTGSTAKAKNGNVSPANTGAAVRAWVTYSGGPNGPPNDGVTMSEGDLWFIVPGINTDPWTLNVWYQGYWQPVTLP